MSSLSRVCVFQRIQWGALPHTAECMQVVDSSLAGTVILLCLGTSWIFLLTWLIFYDGSFINDLECVVLLKAVNGKIIDDDNPKKGKSSANQHKRNLLLELESETSSQGKIAVSRKTKLAKRMLWG